jgi:hypothetical protein
MMIGIDFGSDSVKTALELVGASCVGASSRTSAVSPRRQCHGFIHRPDPIVLTSAGGRKIPTAIRLHEGSIFYGGEALSMHLRHPTLTFVHLKQMLGWTTDGDYGEQKGGGVGWFARAGLGWYEWLADEERGTLRLTSCCPHLCSSAEELTALLLAHVTDEVAAALAAEQQDRSVPPPGVEVVRSSSQEVLLVVPPWWGGAQVRAASSSSFSSRRRSSSLALPLPPLPSVAGRARALLLWRCDRQAMRQQSRLLLPPTLS